jgi:ATP-dependent DNA ligase
VEAISRLGAKRFVLDGEIVIPTAKGLSFDELLLRIHPAESRVRKLVEANPAVFVAFDLLVDAKGKDLTAQPLAKRRKALESFASSILKPDSRVHVSPFTGDREQAQRWLDEAAGGLDGVMAKRGDLPYQAGNRTGMQKVKRLRTAECVVGGFRWGSSGKRLGSLLLGLYGEDGALHHVGFCSAFNDRTRRDAEERVLPLRGGEGFTGRAPQGHSRWRKEGSGEWEALRPELVVEVQYDHFTSGRFRHGTRFLRWRPDKPPEKCTLRQIEKEGASALGML